jgi:hypothetical protein
MQKFKNLHEKTKTAGNKKISDKSIDRFLTITATAYKVAKIGTIVITGAAAVVAVAVINDKAKNPQDYIDTDEY